MKNESIQKDGGTYSPLQVMRSSAGFYVGRTFTGPDGLEEPGSRESDYFPTREEAELARQSGFIWRDVPENERLYE